jgi:hypothetical protein
MRPREPAVTDPDREAVVAWRRGRLEAAGVAPTLAAPLAGDEDVDLHALIELIEQGCSPALAARILAPLDPRGEAS